MGSGALPEGPAATWSTPCGAMRMQARDATHVLRHVAQPIFWPRRFVAKEVLGQPLPPGPLATRALRNADMREAVAGDALRCAAAYGFRNIQTTVRKVKRGVCEYQFVEVMACPGGCNGGMWCAARAMQRDTFALHDKDDSTLW